MGDHVVMVVDDDDAIRVTLCELLEEEGYKAVGMCNGREALDYLQANPRPCLILLDLMMPVMDGWQFRNEQLKKPDLAEIPVVVITAAGDARSSTARATRVLPKPLRVHTVLQTVGEVC